jgi:hypothetical protein
MPLMTMSIASCGGLLASEDAKRSAVCEPTQEARQAHAGALIALGGSDVERNAKRTGAAALGAVAAGCGEALGDAGPQG